MNTEHTHNETREVCPECKSEIGHKILCKTGNRRAIAYQSKLRCTKSKVTYAETLAKERDQLRARLNKVTAQRDELLVALKDVSQWAFNTSTHQAWQDRLNAAISKAQQP